MEDNSTDTSDVREGKPAVNKEILDGNISGRRATSWAISCILFHILTSTKMVESNPMDVRYCLCLLTLKCNVSRRRNCRAYFIHEWVTG